MSNAMIEASGLKESICTCIECVSMCNSQPCLPTPDEATALKAKYPDKMIEYTMRYRIPPKQQWHSIKVCGPKISGQDSRTDTDGGRCVFLNVVDRCELHGLGEKPMEGRLANHSVKQGAAMYAVLSQWIMP